MCRPIRILPAACCWLGLCVAMAADRALGQAPPELSLLLEEDFEAGADRWSPTDPAAWKILPGRGGQVFAQTAQSDYKPPYRSPFNIALLRDVIVADFDLRVRVRSTIADYGHRDVCLVFGYQDPAHFYYVHFGKQADDHANQIFIVNDAPRKMISLTSTDGTPWDDEWHELRVVRKAAEGTVEAYFDDMETPAMTATDSTFLWGGIGLGTFDDTADFDDVTLRGTVAAPR